MAASVLPLFGSLISSVYANEEQKKNLQTQYNLALNNWYAQQNYNSPLNQRKRLEAAGINPNVAFQGATTTSGNATEMSPVPDYSTITPAAAYSQQFLNNTAQSIAALAQASKSGVETKQIKSLLAEQVRSLELGNISQDLKNQFQEFENMLQKLYGKRRVSAETEKAVVSYYEGLNNLVLQGKQGKQIDLQNMETAMNVLIKDLQRQGQGIEVKMLEERLKQLPRMLKAELDKTNAEAFAASASGQEHLAGADVKRTEAEFNRSTMDVRKKLLEDEETSKVLRNASQLDQVFAILRNYDWNVDRIKIAKDKNLQSWQLRFIMQLQNACEQIGTPIKDVFPILRNVGK